MRTDVNLIIFLVDIRENLAFSLNNNMQTDVIYFDFAKAFDSVNHDILIKKLKYEYGLEGRLLKFLVDYLRDRKQCVVIGGYMSEVKAVASGVPQGSVLGPLLFLVCINDLEKKHIKSNVNFFADDTMMYSIVKDPVHTASNLNHDLDVTVFIVDFIKNMCELFLYPF